MVFTASRLDAHQERDIVGKKAESSHAVCSGKEFNGLSPSLCGRQVDGRTSRPTVTGAQPEDLQTDHELILTYILPG